MHLEAAFSYLRHSQRCTVRMRGYQQLQNKKLLFRGATEFPFLVMSRTQLSKFMSNLLGLHSWPCFSKEAGLAKFHWCLPPQIIPWFCSMMQSSSGYQKFILPLKKIRYLNVKAVYYMLPQENFQYKTLLIFCKKKI